MARRQSGEAGDHPASAVVVVLVTTLRLLHAREGVLGGANTRMDIQLQRLAVAQDGEAQDVAGTSESDLLGQFGRRLHVLSVDRDDDVSRLQSRVLRGTIGRELVDDRAVGGLHAQASPTGPASAAESSRRDSHG